MSEIEMPAAGGLPKEKVTSTFTDLGFANGLTSDLGGGFTYVKETRWSASGRMTERSYGANGQVRRTLTWDELGQLEKASIEGQDTSMVYDATGERLIRRAPDGKTTLYLGAMELELSAGQVKGTRYYTTIDGATVAMRAGGDGVTWMASGLHGSQQLGIDDATGQVSRERYLPFGQRRGADDLPFTDRGFLGKTEDASTDLTYLSARYYDPTIAKFISTDPLLNLDKPDWANPYSYAANNPIGLSDPTGLAPIMDSGGGAGDPCAKNKSSKKCLEWKKNAAASKVEGAQAAVDAHLATLLGVAKKLLDLIARELGITAGIECFKTGNIDACSETALNILSSLVGGVVGKLAAKYGMPWKWKKLAELGKQVWDLGRRAVAAIKG